MSAYVLVIMTWISGANGTGGWGISQQEYANMASCQNAAGIITNMVKDEKTIQWACIPKEN
jgi:hypothetical protein